MSQSDFRTLALEACRQPLHPRARDAHKGDFGHVLIVGGDYGMGGACCLAGEAALVAQGLSLLDAARLGVVAHATAGDKASTRGERGILARDLFEGLRTCLN